MLGYVRSKVDWIDRGCWLGHMKLGGEMDNGKTYKVIHYPEKVL